MNKNKKILIAFYILSIVFSGFVAALEPMEELDLSSITAQGGVYLSGDLTINAQGGPLNVSGPSAWLTNCSTGNSSDANKSCGARIAISTEAGSNSGFLVLDDIKGRFSFEGMTLKTRHIDSGFGGDGASFNNDVLEVGLPNEVRYENVSFTLAHSNTARPSDAVFQQSDIMNVRIDGDVSMRGNLLLFPTGNP
jgi:hypothetical protein